MKRELIGTVGVDSGQVMVVDPCAVRHWGGEKLSSRWSKKAPTGRFDYEGACTASLSPQGYGAIGGGLAVVAGTVSGDGDFPVYAMRNSRGVVVRLVVELNDSF
jgi:hypothetical protein